MNYETRFKKYKELKKIEPKIWTRNHHMLRILGNIAVVNLSMYTIAKVYWNLLPDKYNTIRIRSIMAFTFLATALIISLNYSYLDRYVYNKFYSHLTDEEFKILYYGVIAEHHKANNKFS